MKSQARSELEEEFLLILREIQAGERAIDALLVHPWFTERAERICRYIKRDEEAAGELLQESCLKMLVLGRRQRVLNKLNIPDEKAFFRWFYVLARNVDRNNYRREHRGETHIAIDTLPQEGINLISPDTDLEGETFLAEFLESLKSLPEKKARAVNLRLRGHSNREIAEILNRAGIKCSHVAVHEWVKTALKEFLKGMK